MLFSGVFLLASPLILNAQVGSIVNTGNSAVNALPIFPGQTSAAITNITNNGSQFGQSINQSYNYGGGFAPGGRASLAGWRSRDATEMLKIEQGFAHAGPIQFSLTAGMDTIYNSNINVSQNSPVAAFGVNPSVAFGVHWLITRRNELDLSIGAGLVYYFANPKYNTNSLTIGPGTVLRYSMYVGDFVFTLYDTPSISSSPSQGSGVSNVINFSQMSNLIGLSALWDLNKMSFTAGVQETSILSLNNQFNSQNSNQTGVFCGAYYRYTPTLSIGTTAAVSQTTYTQNVLNNSTQYQAGLVIQNQFSRFTAISFGFGMQYYDFANNGVQGVNGPVLQQSGGNVTNVTATGGGGNTLSPYFTFALSNRLNRYYAQSISLYYTTGASGISNTVTQSGIAYTGNWRLNRQVTLDTTLTAQNSSFSGEATGASTQLSASLGFTYNLMRRVPVTVRYTYTDQVGQSTVNGYVQSIFSVGVAYKF